MSQLFRRITQQVVNPARRRVHARAGLPHEPAGWTQATVQPLNVEPAGDAASQSAGPTARDVRPPPASPRRNDATPFSVDRNPAGPRSASDPGQDTDWPDLAARTDPEQAGVDTRRQSPRHREKSPPARAHNPPPAGRAMGQSTSRRDAPDRTDGTAWVAPAPLLPLAVTPPLAASPRRATRNDELRGIDVRVGAAEPPEVHVHIGRIEVTTTNEATGQSRPRKNRKKPMSLDDYLARREQSKP